MKRLGAQSIAALFLLPLAILQRGNAAQSQLDLSPSEFGFKTEERVDSQFRKTVTLIDPQSGVRLLSIYSPLEKLEFQSETLASGRLISRLEIRGHQEIQEQFIPIHTRTLFEIKHKGWIRIEKTTWNQGIAKTETDELEEKEATQSCQTNSTQSSIDRLLSDLSWLSFRPENNQSAVPLGNNFVARNCNSYVHGGVDGLARELSAGLRSGLSCMARLGPERRRDAAKLLAFLNKNSSKPAEIRCGHEGDITGRGDPDDSKKGEYLPMVIETDEDARAYMPTSPDFPALQFNLDSEEFKEDASQARRTLFHEMLHWLGYRHSHGVDITYLTELCCVPGDSDSAQKSQMACDLLSKPPAVESDEYQRRFAKIMNDHYRAEVAITGAWTLSRGKNNTSPLWASISEIAVADRNLFEAEYLAKGKPLYYIVLGQASLGSLPAQKQGAAQAFFNREIASTYSKGDIQNAALILGNTLNALLNRNARAFEASWQEYRQIRKRACTQMNAHEKEQINEALNRAHSDFFRVTPSIFQYYEEFKQPCS